MWHNVVPIALQSSSNSMRTNESFVRDEGYVLVDIRRKVNNGVKQFKQKGKPSSAFMSVIFGTSFSGLRIM